MTRRVFYSFEYKPDNWRVSQVRNIGAIEANAPATDNDWETVTKGEDPAIQKWIAEQMKGRTCTVVLVGETTAGRKWIDYEIIESWKKGMGVVGVCIHGLKNNDSQQCACGKNPFEHLTLAGKKFSSIVKFYNSPYKSSADVYKHIASNLANWIEEAIKIRAEN